MSLAQLNAIAIRQMRLLTGNPPRLLETESSGDGSDLS